MGSISTLIDTLVFLILPFYLQMCKVLAENVHESVQSYLANQPASLQLRKKLLPLEAICEDINRILSPQLQNPATSEQTVLGSNQQSLAEAPTSVAGSSSPSIQQQDDQRPSAEQDTEMRDALTKSDPRKDSSQSTKSDSEKESSKSPCDVPTSADSHSPQVEPTCVPAGTGEDVEMEEKKNEADAAPDGSKHKSAPGIIILDD